MNWALSVAGLLYVGLALGGIVMAGMPGAVWTGLLKPALMGTFSTPKSGRRAGLVYRIAGGAVLIAFFALLAIVLSPLFVYRCLWELWHWARGGGSQPPREPAEARNAKAA